MNLKKILGTSLAVLICISGCAIPSQSKDTKSITTKNNFQPLTDKDGKIEYGSKIVTANNKFGFKIYSELLKNSSQNIFISPSSILFCLSMVYNGADGKTKEEIAKALELSDMTLEDVNKFNNLLMRQLINTDSEVKLDIANSLWGNKNIEFNKDFMKNTSDFYKADITSLDLATPDAVKAINGWVSNSTQNKITKIVDKISPETLLILINAIYFKGNWTNKFDKQLTKDQNFTNSKGKDKNVSTMSIYDEFKYYKGDDFQAVSLPYGKENVSMYVFLPDAKDGINDFHKKLTNENWESWLNKFKRSSGSVQLPKFKVEYESSLNDSLKALGMTSAFDNADFSKMLTGNIKPAISDVRHKTYVDVNEEGTEAAAVTSATVVATAVMQPQEPFKFIADHPFFYAIRDGKTGDILFMGTVLDL